MQERVDDQTNQDTEIIFCPLSVSIMSRWWRLGSGRCPRLLDGVPGLTDGVDGGG